MSAVSIAIDDPLNRQILAVSEDRVQGFHPNPFAEIARQASLPVGVVVDRISAMLQGGTIRRVRQTLLATNLAPGALVAWQLPAERIEEGFDFLFQQDPFSGHVVVRSADPASPGASYKLWTTLKVPQGYSLEKHCEVLRTRIGADHFRIMPAKRLFALGVGHLRRRDMQPGSRSDELAEVTDVKVTALSEAEWRVLTALKRELSAAEVGEGLWNSRAREIDMPLEEFCETARRLNERKVIGRFSTFLEHVKPLADGQRVTKFNALFHWAVPPGREIEAGREVGRHHILTHAYWREGGPEFRDVNIMAVAHGTDKELVLKHKAAIDTHLAEAGIPAGYTNVFWGGRSEIKPSEISPFIYREWCAARRIDPEAMRAAV